ncbi:hypothetical protein [Butyrivibrio sp. WCD2001]|nr:hypothetical protein [Butyrivibrio sp. WCD2001]
MKITLEEDVQKLIDKVMAIAAFGLGCKLVVVKKDGTKDEIK